MENMFVRGLDAQRSVGTLEENANGQSIWTSTTDHTSVLQMVVRNFQASHTAEVFFGMNVRSMASME
jgi:hypothetical protein